MATTARIQIDRRQFDALLKRLNAERLARPIKDGMKEGGGEVIEEVRRIIQPARDTGQTAGSYTFDMKGSNLSAIQGRVYSDLLSAETLEVGRKPGNFPPVDAIYAWARRKLGISDMSIAFAIARAISREGSPKRRRGGSVQPYHQLEIAATTKANAMRDAMLKRVKKAL
jgi:hypothetical protein